MLSFKANEFFTFVNTFKFKLASVRLVKLFVCILICRSVSVMILNTLSSGIIKPPLLVKSRNFEEILK